MLRYGVKIREENLGTGILYIPDLLYKIIRAGKAGEFSPCERMFICQLTVEAVEVHDSHGQEAQYQVLWL